MRLEAERINSEQSATRILTFPVPTSGLRRLTAVGLTSIALATSLFIASGLPASSQQAPVASESRLDSKALSDLSALISQHRVFMIDNDTHGHRFTHEHISWALEQFNRMSGTRIPELIRDPMVIVEAGAPDISTFDIAFFRRNGMFNTRVGTYANENQFVFALWHEVVGHGIAESVILNNPALLNELTAILRAEGFTSNYSANRCRDNLRMIRAGQPLPPTMQIPRESMHEYIADSITYLANPQIANQIPECAGPGPNLLSNGGFTRTRGFFERQLNLRDLQP